MIARAISQLIRAYQYFVSPFLGTSCRYFPSCSEYARQAMIRHGAIRGTTLSLARICRCHPWHAGGHDPVP